MPYCENPICKPACPVYNTAICKPYTNEFKNDDNLNICECIVGWSGTDCSNKIFMDFR